MDNIHLLKSCILSIAVFFTFMNLAMWGAALYQSYAYEEKDQTERDTKNMLMKQIFITLFISILWGFWYWL